MNEKKVQNQNQVCSQKWYSFNQNKSVRKKFQNQNDHYLSKNGTLSIKPITLIQGNKELAPIRMWGTSICACNNSPVVES